MPPVNPRPSPFLVEILPTAWTQLAYLSQEDYLALKHRLEELAELASSGRLPLPESFGTAGPEPHLSFRLGDTTVRYEVDPRRKVLRLVAVTRPRPQKEQAHGS